MLLLLPPDYEAKKKKKFHIFYIHSHACLCCLCISNHSSFSYSLCMYTRCCCCYTPKEILSFFLLSFSAQLFFSLYVYIVHTYSRYEKESTEFFFSFIVVVHFFFAISFLFFPAISFPKVFFFFPLSVHTYTVVWPHIVCIYISCWWWWRSTESEANTLTQIQQWVIFFNIFFFAFVRRVYRGDGWMTGSRMKSGFFFPVLSMWGKMYVKGGEIRCVWGSRRHGGRRKKKMLISNDDLQRRVWGYKKRTNILFSQISWKIHTA